MIHIKDLMKCYDKKYLCKLDDEMLKNYVHVTKLDVHIIGIPVQKCTGAI